MVIPNIEAWTALKYKIVSQDANGNKTETEEKTFKSSDNYYEQNNNNAVDTANSKLKITPDSEQKNIVDSGKDLQMIIKHTGKKKDTQAQMFAMKKYTEPVTKSDKKITINQKYAINNFIIYGTQSTKKLTQDKRYQAVKKFKANFKKLPKSESDWKEVLKIVKIIK